MTETSITDCIITCVGMLVICGMFVSVALADRD